MKLNSIQTLIGTATTAACLLSMTGVAQAGSFVNGWNYAQDYFNDGTGGYESQAREGNNYKSSGYEMYGMAVHLDGDTITVGINTNLALTGRDVTSSKAKDGNIGMGDFFFNIGGEEYGVHFAETNDSFGRGNGGSNHAAAQAADEAAGTNTLGLYKNITTKNVTARNWGWSSLKSHHNHTKNRSANKNDQVGKSLGDFESDEMSYYNASRKGPTSIKSGTKVENDNFQLLNQDQLGALGLNFSNAFGTDSSLLGTQTFGFSFTRTPEMLGEFVGHLFAECMNDGIAIAGKFEEKFGGIVKQVPVPEPTALGGLTLFGLMLVGSKLRKRA